LLDLSLFPNVAGQEAGADTDDTHQWTVERRVSLPCLCSFLPDRLVSTGPVYVILLHFSSFCHRGVVSRTIRTNPIGKLTASLSPIRPQPAHARCISCTSHAEADMHNDDRDLSLLLTFSLSHSSQAAHATPVRVWTRCNINIFIRASGIQPS